MSTGLCQRLVIPLPILLTTDTASSTCFSGQPCIFADFDLFPYTKVYQSGQVDATPVQQKKCTALRCSGSGFHRQSERHILPWQRKKRDILRYLRSHAKIGEKMIQKEYTL